MQNNLPPDCPKDCPINEGLKIPSHATKPEPAPTSNEIVPKPFFVLKTKNEKQQKVFINLCGSHKVSICKLADNCISFWRWGCFQASTWVIFVHVSFHIANCTIHLWSIAIFVYTWHWMHIWHEKTQKVWIALKICTLKVLHKSTPVIENCLYNGYCRRYCNWRSSNKIFGKEFSL